MVGEKIGAEICSSCKISQTAISHKLGYRLCWVVRFNSMSKTPDRKHE